MSTVYDIPVQRITGESTSLSEFKGKVLLVVNVASKCGLTPQYEGLETLYERYRAHGLVVAGFPANNFKSQEPGTNEEIQSFCIANFGVKFPMFSKISVADVPFREKLKGYGIEANADPEVLWNFEKFLVSRQGEVVKRFAPDTVPDAPELITAIKEELARE